MTTAGHYSKVIAGRNQELTERRIICWGRLRCLEVLIALWVLVGLVSDSTMDGFIPLLQVIVILVMFVGFITGH